MDGKCAVHKCGATKMQCNRDVGMEWLKGISSVFHLRKADIWSVGAIGVEMATGYPPFAELAPMAALFKLGSSNTIPPLPSHLSPQAIDFLTLCFTRQVTFI